VQPLPRRGGLRRISPSCRSYCGKNKKRCDPVQRGRSKRETSLIRLCTVPQFAICPAHNERVLMEQKCYVLRKTQPFVGCRTEPSGWSARFYIGALCNSAIKLAAPKGGTVFLCVRLSGVRRRLGEGQKPECARCEARSRRGLAVTLVTSFLRPPLSVRLTPRRREVPHPQV
jgi:hypothetical protein